MPAWVLAFLILRPIWPATDSRDLRGGALGSSDSIPSLEGTRVSAGRVTLGPATITFLAIAERRESEQRLSASFW
jgi:hypothetical protein